jgi:hypothetical protein
MEEVLNAYQKPYHKSVPVICFDEASVQLFGETRPHRPPKPRQPKKVDYEYERKGVCHQLMFCEPLTGWRHVCVSWRRTRTDYAQAIKQLLTKHYPKAKRIILIQDNLNTHNGASLYQTFQPQEARELSDRIEYCHTPKHASWLNMAEIEINVMKKQCLSERIKTLALIEQKIAKWEEERNQRKACIHWTFTIAAARQKLKKCYPPIPDK